MTLPSPHHADQVTLAVLRTTVGPSSSSRRSAAKASVSDWPDASSPTYKGSGIGDETSRLGVYDLKKKKRVRIAKLNPNGGSNPEIETGLFVAQFAVTSKGSLVWLISGERVEEVADPPELRAADGTARKERIVDSGNLDLKSLKISRDEKTILYRKDGADKSAKLRS